MLIPKLKPVRKCKGLGVIAWVSRPIVFSDLANNTGTAFGRRIRRLVDDAGSRFRVSVRFTLPVLRCCSERES